MASEAPSDQGERPKKVPVLGPLLGFLVVFHAVWVTLTGVLEAEVVRQIPFLWQIPLLLGGLVGAGIGGTIQLGTQGRAAEIPRLLRLLLRVALSVIFYLVSLFLGAWLGERLYGRVGYWIGLVASAVLVVCVRSWLARRSSSENPSPLPPV
jgi:hypothetical protein